MDNPHTQPGVPPKTPEHTESKPPSGKVGRTALAIALLAVVLGWISTFAGPFAARLAVARGDYGNIYVVQIVAWVTVAVFNVGALVLGIIGARRPVGKVLSGAAIGIGAVGLLGLVVTIIGMFLLTPLLSNIARGL